MYCTALLLLLSVPPMHHLTSASSDIICSMLIDRLHQLWMLYPKSKWFSKTSPLLGSNHKIRLIETVSFYHFEITKHFDDHSSAVRKFLTTSKTDKHRVHVFPPSFQAQFIIGWWLNIVSNCFEEFNLKFLFSRDLPADN